jgi:hypothetical protein
MRHDGALAAFPTKGIQTGQMGCPEFWDWSVNFEAEVAVVCNLCGKHVFEL